MERQTSLDNLSVCRGTGELYGAMTIDGVEMEQRCRSVTDPYRDELWHRLQTSLPEPAGDFACAVELCYCCASWVIGSGSRFSSFFCDECGARIRQLRDVNERPVIPLGRHSVMNGLALSAADAMAPQLVAAWGDAMRQSFDRIERLDRWRRSVVEDHFIGWLPGARRLPLQGYLAFTRRCRLTKRTMFQQLCRYFSLDVDLVVND